jgi:hypothetical protein
MAYEMLGSTYYVVYGLTFAQIAVCIACAGIDQDNHSL